MKEHDQGSVQSVYRALDLLEAFLDVGPEVGLTTLAKKLELNKATAYRLLSTLEQRGYVERSPNSRDYRLGARLLELGGYYQFHLNLRNFALPILTAVAEETKETAFLIIKDDDDGLCIERIENEREVHIFHLRVGGRLPLHIGAGPRVLLSGMENSEVEAYALRSGLPPFTPNSITSTEKLLEDVELTRKRGYALSYEDVTMGVAAIGAPVYDHLGKIIAAVSLSSLTLWFTPEKVVDLAKALVRTSEVISNRMGYRK